jgi:hypothetical protein
MNDKERMTEWAAGFKADHHCETCPFVKNESDVGIGIVRDCDAVCGLPVEDIVKEMEGYGVEV